MNDYFGSDQEDSDMGITHILTESSDEEEK